MTRFIKYMVRIKLYKVWSDNINELWCYLIIREKNNRVYNTPHIPQADACVKQKFLTYKTHKLDLEILYLNVLVLYLKHFLTSLSLFFLNTKSKTKSCINLNKKPFASWKLIFDKKEKICVYMVRVVYVVF